MAQMKCLATSWHRVVPRLILLVLSSSCVLSCTSCEQKRRPSNWLPSGIDVEQEFAEYKAGKIEYVYRLPVFGQEYDLFITDSGREADYGFIELGDEVSMWLRDSSIESRITIASYKDGAAFVIITYERARELEKRSYTPAP